MSMMQTNVIHTVLTSVLRDVLADEEIVVTRALSADDVSGWDSLTHIRIIVSLQSAFKIRFSAVEAGKLRNCGELLDLIENKLKAVER